jgi:hypothetical protein
LGLIVAMKVFLWPLAVWLAITRRHLAAAISIACGGLFTLVGWASIGFVGFADYPAMLRAAQQILIMTEYRSQRLPPS